MKFSDNLKSFRIVKGIGQKELAKAMHTTVKTVSHWETGYCEPSISQLCLLADFFDTTVDELIGRTY